MNVDRSSVRDPDHALRLDVTGQAARKAAFRRLLRTGAPVSLAAVAADLDIEEAAVESAAVPLITRGVLKFNDQGRIVGAGGLSVTPDRHAMFLQENPFWAWCAWDVLGIFGVSGLSGHVVSPSPEGGNIQIHFQGGRPQPTDVVLLLPDEELMAACHDVYEEWCSASNFFRSHDAAVKWASKHSVPAEVLALGEASERARAAWSHLVGPSAEDA